MRKAKFHSSKLLQGASLLDVAVCERAHLMTDLAAETVQVPQMAESISEGTLKSWLKQPGEFVNADEEVATIETDKVRYHVRNHSWLLRQAPSPSSSNTSVPDVASRPLPTPILSLGMSWQAIRESDSVIR